MTKRQHFVPRSNLKLFSKNEKHIWVLDKDNGVVRCQNIGDTAVVKNFYADDSHSHPLDIKEISELEGQASTIIKKLDDTKSLNDVELELLCNFVSLQFLRTPEAKERADKLFFAFWNGLRTRYKNNQLKKPGEFEEMVADFLKEDIGSSEVQDFLDGNVNLSAPNTIFVDNLVTQGFKIAEILSKQNWVFHYTQNEHIWVTSDNPVSVSDSIEEKGLHPVLNEETIKFLPLSGKVMLSITGRGFSVEQRIMYKWAVRDLNLMTALNATRYVYSGSEELLNDINQMLKEYKNDPDSYRDYLIKNRSK